MHVLLARCPLAGIYMLVNYVDHLHTHLAVITGSRVRSISTTDCTLSLRLVKMITRPGWSAGPTPASAVVGLDTTPCAGSGCGGAPWGWKWCRTTSRSAAILGWVAALFTSCFSCLWNCTDKHLVLLLQLRTGERIETVCTLQV